MFFCVLYFFIFVVIFHFGLKESGVGGGRKGGERGRQQAESEGESEQGSSF